MVGEATPKSAKAGADESSAFDAPPLKIPKIIFSPARSHKRLFLERTSASLIPPGRREGRIPRLVGFTLDTTTNILGNSIQLFLAWSLSIGLAELQTKVISRVARQYMEMYMEDILSSCLAIGHENIDAFAPDITSSNCLRHVLSYLE